MGYFSCRAESSAATCRSITALSPANDAAATSSSSPAPIRRFDYAELEAATANFAAASLLGRGSHGSVYRASLPDGPVAVKRPAPRRPETPSTAEPSSGELLILSSLRGPRFVNLLGFAARSSSDEVLLVVEYMPNGTLFDLLHSRPNPPSWPRRLRLALQTAKALRALHAASPPVVHRDVKSANVLLDGNLDARLGDFGLAVRIGISPPPAGTLGYLDPGYVTPEDLSTKTDVFSFGILLFELLSGRKALDVAHSPPSVADWAVPLLRRGKVGLVFDPRIPPPRDPGARRQLAALACACVRPSAEKRPSMADVVEQLKVLCRSVPGRGGWSGLNPCAVVDIEKTIAKISLVDAMEEREVEEDDDAAAAGGGAKKTTPGRTLRNARVFSDSGAGAAAGGKRRNLLELMARIDAVDPKFSNAKSTVPDLPAGGSCSGSNEEKENED